MFKSITLCSVILSFLAGTVYCEPPKFDDILFLMKKKFDTIDDYTCIYESFTSSGKEAEDVAYRYFFKKPKLIRMEVLTPGKFEGTVLIYKDNKVKTKLGKGPFSLFTSTFDPDHKWVTDIRGHGLNESDWGWFIDEHIKNIKWAQSNYEGEELVGDRTTLRYKLISKDLEKTKSIANEKIWVDKNDYLLIKFILYDSSENIIQFSFFKNISLNNKLKDTLFEKCSR